MQTYTVKIEVEIKAESPVLAVKQLSELMESGEINWKLCVTDQDGEQNIINIKKVFLKEL